jgi:hypothetical protein
MEKQFQTLLAATHNRACDLNAAWHKVIAYAVKKAHSDKESGLAYVQAALDAAPAGIRKNVASAFRQLNINISALERGQFRAEGVRNPKAQEKTFERIKAGDIPDVVAMADRVPREKKADNRSPMEVAQDAIDRLLARLKKDNPDAAAVLNDKLAAPTPKCAMFSADGTRIDLTPDEYDAAIKTIMASRIGLRKAA